MRCLDVGPGDLPSFGERYCRVELMRLASQREQSVTDGVGIFGLVEYLSVEREPLLGPDDKRSGDPCAYLLGLRPREQLGDIARIHLPVILEERSWIAASSTSGSTIRNRNPRSCEQLPPALCLRCEHHVSLAQTLDGTCSIVHHHGSSHVHLLDAKCVATP
jgi:hypothetical protein